MGYTGKSSGNIYIYVIGVIWGIMEIKWILLYCIGVTWGIMDNEEVTNISCWGYMEDNGKYWGYMGRIEHNMETTMLYWGYMGIMENKMATTISDM